MGYNNEGNYDDNCLFWSNEEAQEGEGEEEEEQVLQCSRVV